MKNDSNVSQIETADSTEHIITDPNVDSAPCAVPTGDPTQKKAEGLSRLYALYDVINYVVLIHGKNQTSQAIVKEWNLTNCTPPFTDSEMDVSLAFYALSDLEKDVSKVPDKPQSKAQKVISLLTNDATLSFFHDQNRIGYACISADGRRRNIPINSSEFTNYCRHKLFKSGGESITDQQLNEVLSLFNAQALYENKQYSLYHRVTQTDDAFYYDLLNAAGEIVKIDATGWKIVPSTDAPVMFKQGTGKEQVRPIAGGNLKDLLDLINIKKEDEQMLYLCTLPVRLIRDIDQAIFYLHGPAGSAKSTMVRMTKDLLDPSSGGISMPVRKVDDAIAALNQTWVFANDNISKIDDDLSDFLCVVATGAESSRRKLYTDSDVAISSVKNPVYLNGINVEAHKSDLLSRTILLKTEAVKDSERRNDKEIMQLFTDSKALLLGALFDTLSKAMVVKNSLTHKTAFRMADFALWGAACAEVLGYGASAFEKALKYSVQQRAYDAIYSLSAGRAILEYINQYDSFDGTMTELFLKLKDNYDQGWHEPIAQSPASLGKKLRELENSLSTVGIGIDFPTRTGSERKVLITRISATQESSGTLGQIEQQ